MIKLNNRKLSLFILSALAMTSAACDKPKSNWLVSPPKHHEARDENGDLSFDITPKAEIIFVVDNSASMSAGIQKVSDNIDQFVNEFSKDNPLEYNLSVVSVYDSRRFSSKEHEKFVQDPSFHKLGQFREVKKSPTEVVAGKSYISSDDADLGNLLKNTLKIGVQDLATGGPEVEELFSPIAANYNLNGYDLANSLSKKQSGFFKGKGSFKIMFFVSDATDQSKVSASEFYQAMVQSAGGDREKVLAFGAIVLPNDPSCKKDPGLPAFKMVEFFDLARLGAEDSNYVSLCDPNFGAKLAGFGKSVRTRVMKNVIDLKESVPGFSSKSQDSLRVFYGPTELKIGEDFVYDTATNSIEIASDLKLVKIPDAKLKITYKEYRAK